jgi:hypothetical protein
MTCIVHRLVLAVALAFVAMPSLAVAQTKPYAQPGPPKPGAANSEQPWQPPVKPNEKQQWQEMKDQEHSGRSGFWTSPYPAKHGAYRYRLLLLGIAIALTMGLIMWRLIRRAGLDRRN